VILPPAYRHRRSEDQVAETRRVLREMNDKADRAIDDHAARSTPMMPNK
jgi:hypothetical protein